MVRAVVGAVAVFDGPSVAMLVAPVVSLLFFVFAGVVVMVVMSAMGFHRRTQAEPVMTTTNAAMPRRLPSDMGR